MELQQIVIYFSFSYYRPLYRFEPIKCESIDFNLNNKYVELHVVYDWLVVCFEQVQKIHPYDMDNGHTCKLFSIP